MDVLRRRRRLVFLLTLVAVGALVTLGASPGVASGELTITHQPPPTAVAGAPLDLAAEVHSPCSPATGAHGFTLFPTVCHDIVVTLTYTVGTSTRTQQNAIPGAPVDIGVPPGERAANFVVPAADIQGDSFTYTLSASQQVDYTTPCSGGTTTLSGEAGPFTVPVAPQPPPP